MADTGYLSNASTTSRWTRGDIRKFATEVIGETVSNLTTVRATLVDNLISSVFDRWMGLLPHAFHGYGERVTDLTFDPDSVDTRIEMPEDFFGLLSGGRAYIQASDGSNQYPLTIITETEWEDSIRGGDSEWDDREVPFGLLFGLSTNKLRFLEIRPTPTLTQIIHLPYRAHITELSNDNDELEAPKGAHRGIAFEVVGEYLDMRGFPEKASGYFSKSNRLMQELSGQVPAENPRTIRFRTFRQARGSEIVNYPR